MASDNKIRVGGAPGEPKEGEATESITPGHVVEYGDTPEQFQKHATDGGNGLLILADKMEFMGDATNDAAPIDDSYSSGDYMKAILLKKGGYGNALLADGESVTSGDLLVSAGDGTLRAFDGGGGDEQGAALAVAREEVSASGSTERITVEAL